LPTFFISTEDLPEVLQKTIVVTSNFYAAFNFNQIENNRQRTAEKLQNVLFAG